MNEKNVENAAIIAAIATAAYYTVMTISVVVGMVRQHKAKKIAERDQLVRSDKLTNDWIEIMNGTHTAKLDEELRITHPFAMSIIEGE